MDRNDPNVLAALAQSRPDTLPIADTGFKVIPLDGTVTLLGKPVIGMPAPKPVRTRRSMIGSRLAAALRFRRRGP